MLRLIATPNRVSMLLMLVVACGGGESPPGGPACGPTTCGDGTVCCDHCVGSCVPEDSGAQCPDDTDPGRACAPQPCGATDACDVDTEVCVGTGPFGPSVMNDCEPVVTGCEHDRTCDCLAELLCPEGTIQCTDVGVNEIFCDNGTQ